MTDRENNVYKAKLAEQAERYDGKLAILHFSWLLHAFSWLTDMLKILENALKSALRRRQSAEKAVLGRLCVPKVLLAGTTWRFSGISADLGMAGWWRRQMCEKWTFPVQNGRWPSEFVTFQRPPVIKALLCRRTAIKREKISARWKVTPALVFSFFTRFYRNSTVCSRCNLPARPQMSTWRHSQAANFPGGPCLRPKVQKFRWLIMSHWGILIISRRRCPRPLLLFSTAAMDAGRIVGGDWNSSAPQEN